MPDESNIPSERQKLIEDLNASLASGSAPLRYDANDEAIADAQNQAFEKRVHDYAYELASDSGQRAASQAAINAKLPIARLRLKGREKRGVLQSLAEKLSAQQNDFAARRAALDAQEAALAKMDAQFGALIERRDLLALAVSRAEQYQQAVGGVVEALRGQIPETYLTDFIQGSNFGTAVVAGIIDSYQKLIASERAVADWEHVRAQLQVKLDVLNQEIAAFQKTHGL